MPPRRPPPVAVDDAVVRRDVDSADVRRVYPDLPATPAARNAFLARLDREAHATIRGRFPDFVPRRSVHAAATSATGAAASSAASCASASRANAS